MAIKIPYMYTKYDFSEEATEYSKKLAKRKGSVVGICFAMWLIITIMVCGLAALFDPPDGVIAFLLIISLVAGIAAGIIIDKKINKSYRDKRDAALRRDIIKVIGEVSEERMQEIIYELTHTEKKTKKNNR